MRPGQVIQPEVIFSSTSRYLSSSARTSWKILLGPGIVRIMGIRPPKSINQKPFYLKALRVMGWSVGLLTSQGSRELFDSVALREGYKLLFIAKGDTQGTVHTGIYCVQGISVSQDLS